MGKASDNLASLETIYKVHLSRQYEQIEFLGLPHLKEERPLTLPEIYVPLSLTDKPGGDRLYVPDVLEKHRHIVVLGDPGAGKSTLIRVLAHSFSRLEPTPLARRLGNYLPIPIILRDYKVRQWQSPEDMLQSFIDTLQEEVRSQVTVDWLMEKLRNGEGMLLLDGLDEVGSKEDREHLRDKIVWPLLSQMQTSYVILTSRIVGYEEVNFNPVSIKMNFGGNIVLLSVRDVPEYAVTEHYVSPFNIQEIEQFITRWYSAREQDASISQKGIVSLKEALRRNDRIRRLAGNPFLLTMMALVHRITADLPSGRVRLYDKIVEAYLETIQRYRGLECFDATLDQMKRWLAVIGWEMQSRRTGENDSELLVSREEVLAWLTGAMRRDIEAPQTEAIRILDYIARRSGLLIPRGQKEGDEQFAFVHLTFQEYFAAWHLRGRLRRFDDLVADCVEHIEQRHWHETLVLLFEMLTEFEAGDDLADEIGKRCQNNADRRDSAAELFAELLLDEQSGISLERQRQLSAYILTGASQNPRTDTVAKLQQLPPQHYKPLVHEWIEQQLMKPIAEIPPGYFALVPRFSEYREVWPERMAALIEQRGDEAWSNEQVKCILTIAGANVEVCRWAADRLHFSDWLVDISLGTCLADLYAYELIGLPDLSGNACLLICLRAAYAISRSMWVRLFVLDYGVSLIEHFPSIASARQRASTTLGTYTTIGFGVLPDVSARMTAGLFAISHRINSAGNLHDQTHHWFASTLGEVLDFNPAAHQWTNTPDAAVMLTDWLLFSPDLETGLLAEHISALKRWSESEIDMKRLLGLSGLLLLGEGTPEICTERNDLLDRGMTRPETFTFPADVREITDTPEFQQELPGLLKQIFLHEPGSPWLPPELFAPGNPAHQIMCAKPREFYALAAEILDPEGKTELKRWRNLNAASS